MDALLVAVGWELLEQHPKQEHPARQSKGTSSKNQLLLIRLSFLPKRAQFSRPFLGRGRIWFGGPKPKPISLTLTLFFKEILLRGANPNPNPP